MLSLNGWIDKDQADEWWDFNIVSESKAIYTPLSRKSRLTCTVAQGKYCTVENKKVKQTGFSFLQKFSIFSHDYLPQQSGMAFMSPPGETFFSGNYHRSRFESVFLPKLKGVCVGAV